MSRLRSSLAARLAVYLVTDPSARLGVVETARRAAEAGAGLVQLRDKTASDADFVALGRALKSALDPLGVPLIVNDRIEAARQIGAAGVHVGQSDTPVALVRDRLGPDPLLGLSIEAPGQLADVPWSAVDYIGAGPVRGTATKTDHAPPIGVDGLATIVAGAPCPVVAIGGLAAGDAADVIRAGAAGLAVVSAITAAHDPFKATRILKTAWEACT